MTNRNGRLYEHQGQTHTIPEWSKLLGIPAKTIRCRLRRGKSIREALRPSTKKKRVQVEPAEGQGTLCWDCQNYGGKCSWSSRLQPVEGWEAERHYKPSVGGDGITYKVLACPLFLRDEPRRGGR